MADEADLANDALSLEMSAIMSARKKQTVKVVEHLECIECGCEIPLRRREAIPGVERCIHCQTEYEKGN